MERGRRNRLLAVIAMGFLFGLFVFGVVLWGWDVSTLQAAGIGLIAALATGWNWWILFSHDEEQYPPSR
jgi:hypothetical protein